MNGQVNVSPEMEKSKHPKGLYLCGITNTWERFAFYGVRSVLIFYLSAQVATGGLGMTKADAASLFATYSALTYLSPVIGGWINDRFLGAQACVIIGSLLMSAGYLVPFLSNSKASAYVMMALVVAGTGLFKGNLNTMVGSLYEQNDPKKDGAFSIMYSFVNIGAMIGPIITGLCANQFFAQKGADGKISLFGFKYVFLVGAIGGLLTALTFMFGKSKFIGDHGKLPNSKIAVTSKEGDSSKSIANVPLSAAEKSRTIVIVILAFFSTFFWTAYNQASTSIALYTNEFINLNIGSFAMPVQFLDSFNGLMCVVLGPIMSAVWLKLEKSKRGDLNVTQKMALGFVFLAGGFLFMIFAVLQRGTSMDPAIKASVIWVLLFYILQSIGEMCFSPVGNSMVNRLAPPKYASLLMGVWFLSIFAANKLSGYGQALVENLGTLQVFIGIPVFLVVSAVIIFACNKKLTSMAEKFD